MVFFIEDSCMFLSLFYYLISNVNLTRGYYMSKLSNEIKSNGSLVNIETSKKKERSELVKSMLDSISGGWVNVFARWDKQF